MRALVLLSHFQNVDSAARGDGNRSGGGVSGAAASLPNTASGIESESDSDGELETPVLARNSRTG